MDHLSETLVTSQLLTEGQGDVFLAQVKGDSSAPTLFEVEAKTKQHGQKACKTAAVLGGLGAVAALEHAGYGPTKLASYVPEEWTDKAKALLSKIKLPESIKESLKAGFQALGPKAAVFGTGCVGCLHHLSWLQVGNRPKNDERARSC